MEFGARAYMTITYDDGATETFYTDFDENNVRSMSSVANNLYAKHIDPDNGYTLTDTELGVVNFIRDTVAASGN